MALVLNGSGITSANLVNGTIVDEDVADVAASKLTGALPAIDGSALTGLSGGLYSSVALICDQKSSGTDGGTFTAGAWRTRDLNTEISDADGIVSISSNRFTLQAGTYTIEWSAPGHRMARMRSKLKNITTGTDVEYGISAYNHAGYYNTTLAIGMATLTIASASAFEIQHWTSTTVSGDGLGVGGGANGGGVVEKFTMVTIHKHT
jgi:hypothetical protein